jgi:hypothetical protein
LTIGSETTPTPRLGTPSINLADVDFSEARRLLGLYLFVVFYEFSSLYMLENLLSTAFGYAHVVYDPQRADIYFWVCILTPLAILPAGSRLKTAGQFMFPVLTSLIMLTTPLFLVGAVTPKEFWPLYGCILTSITMLAIASRIEFRNFVRPTSEIKFKRATWALGVFFIVLLGIGATQNFQLVSFLDIYKIRDSAEYSSSFVVRVVIMYVFSLGGLFAGIGLLRKSRTLFFIAMLGFGYCYAVSQFKSAALAPGWLGYVYLAMRYFCKDSTWRYYLVLTLPFFVGALLLFLFPDAKGFASNFLVFAYFAFVSYRFYGVSNIAVGLYYDYFRNHAPTYWSHITGINMFVHYPYGGQQIAEVLNNEYGLGNFNAGFLSTDSIGSYGYEVIPLVTLVLAVIYVIFNSAARGIERKVLAMMMIMPALMFNERAISTSLLTGGIIFFIFYLAWMPNAWKTGHADR